MDGLRELGVDVWFALGDRDLAIAIQRPRRLGEGARLTDTLAELGAALGLRARVLPMADEPVRTRVRSGERWIAVAGVHDPRGRRGADRRTPSLRGVERRAADAGGARGDRRGGRDHRRPVEPGHLDRADPRSTRDARRPARQPRPDRRGLADRRRRRAQGPDRGVHGVRAATPPTTEGIAACYAGLIDGLVADEPADGVPVLQTDTLMSDADEPPPRRRRDAALRRGAASDAPHRRRPSRTRRGPSTIAILPVKRFGDREGAPRRRAVGRHAARARRGDGHRRAHGAAAHDGRRGGPARDVRARRRGDRPRLRRERARRRPRGGPERRRRSSASRYALEAGRAARPARARRHARRSIPPSSTRCSTARRPAARSSIVPDRHGTGTNALLLTPPDVIEPAFGPDSRARHEQAAADAGVPCTVEEVETLALDVDTVRGSRRAAHGARQPPRRRGAHARDAQPPGEHAQGRSAAARRAAGRVIVAAALPGIPEVGAGRRPRGAARRRRRQRSPTATCSSSPTRSCRRPRGASSTLAGVQPGERALALAAEHGKDPRLVEVILGESAEIVRSRPGRADLPHAPRLRLRERGRRRVQRRRPAGSSCCRRDPDASARALRARLRELTGVAPGDRRRPTRSAARGASASATSRSGSPACAPVEDWRGRADAGGRTARRDGHRRRRRGRGGGRPRARARTAASRPCSCAASSATSATATAPARPRSSAPATRTCFSERARPRGGHALARSLAFENSWRAVAGAGSAARVGRRR